MNIGDGQMRTEADEALHSGGEQEEPKM